mmetsp:Transcript_7554/g.14057  ORF Transcript_7554/g.14057 Transcript_7554/m.14057 type:complete len:430 (+) Transcript_7554:118-1407(+)
MVESFFRESFLQFPPELTDKVHEALQNRKDKTIENHLKEEDIKEWPIAEWIQKHQQKALIDENLRQQKLKESQRTKADIESKLQQLEFSIGVLSEKSQPSEVQKPNLQAKVMRQDYYEQEQLKAKEAEEEAKRRLAEQKLRRKRLKEQLKAVESKIAQEEAAELEAQRLDREEKEAQYRKKLEEMRAKSEYRKHELSKSFLLVKEKPKTGVLKPLYKKMVEDFDTSFVIPELEKRKAELQKKRERFRPLNKAEIDQHNNSIIRILQEREKSKARSLSQSRSLNASMKDDTKAHLRLELNVSHDEDGPEVMRKRLKEKQKAYAELARELHKPVVSPSKQLELQESIGKLKTQPKRLNRSLADLSIPKPVVSVHSKPKPKAEAKEVQEMRPKYKDYLVKRRESLDELHSKQNMSLLKEIKSKMSMLQSTLY